MKAGDHGIEHTVTARAVIPCDAYLCPDMIRVGHDYVRTVIFPNDETNQSGRPRTLRICAACYQGPTGKQLPPRRTRSKRRPAR